VSGFSRSSGHLTLRPRLVEIAERAKQLFFDTAHAGSGQDELSLYTATNFGL
jgi:hypothetical protein